MSVVLKEMFMKVNGFSYEDAGNRKLTKLQKKMYDFIVLKERVPVFQPSPIRISTISSTCNITKSRVFNLPLLMEYLKTRVKDEYLNIYEPQEGKFRNSLAIKVMLGESKMVNCTLFQNGRITITGADQPEYGLQCAKALLEDIRKVPETFYNVEPDDIDIENHSITMLNTNYDIALELEQRLLYDILTQEYNLFVTYYPEIYSAVSVHYMWQEGKPNGMCTCETSCINEKVLGHCTSGSVAPPGLCHEITVAIFQNGKVLISGATNLKQVSDVYTEINNILMRHIEQLHMPYYSF